MLLASAALFTVVGCHGTYRYFPSKAAREGAEAGAEVDPLTPAQEAGAAGGSTPAAPSDGGPWLDGGSSEPGLTGHGSEGAGDAGDAAIDSGVDGAENFVLSDAFQIEGSGDDNTVVEPSSGLRGAAFVEQSSVMALPAEHGTRAGKLCMSGETAAVANEDYLAAWGAELILELVRSEGSDTGVVDSGQATESIQAWPIGDAIGFSYRIEGQGEGGAGIPELGLRFRALPEGAAQLSDPYCAQRCPGPSCPAHGATDQVLFDDVSYECWVGDNPTLADDMIPLRGVNADQPPTLVPHPRRLTSISWQVHADPGVTKPFDFCVSDIRVIRAR